MDKENKQLFTVMVFGLLLFFGSLHISSQCSYNSLSFTACAAAFFVSLGFLVCSIGRLKGMLGAVIRTLTSVVLIVPSYLGLLSLYDLVTRVAACEFETYAFYLRLALIFYSGALVLLVVSILQIRSERRAGIESVLS